MKQVFLSMLLSTSVIAAAAKVRADDDFANWTGRGFMPANFFDRTTPAPLWDVADRQSPLRCAKTLFRWGGQDDDEGGPAGWDEPLVSDRPDFTEASTTVGRGVLQVETGYTFSRDDADGDITEAHSYPEMLFRYGVWADWLELRLAYNFGVERVATGGGPFATASGADDLYIGAKLGLTAQHGWLPEMALIPQATVPIGHDAFTTDVFCPGVNWLYGWDVTECISTAGSTQMNKTVDEDGTEYLEFAQSWTIGYGLTERLSAYTEWFCFVPSGASVTGTQHYADGGFTYSVTNNLQLDIRGGVGLSKASGDYFVGSGVVMRF